MTEVPELIVADAAAWREWLTAHHAAADSASLVLAKKGITEPTSLTWDEALEEALCFGWIDGRRNARDATTFLQRFTPRRPRSRWSERNVGIIERLTAEDRMQPAGVAQVEQAKADGRWDAAYGSATTIQVPDDLVAALAAEPTAQAMFEILTSANRFSILYDVGDAKRPETRARRIQKYVEMLSRGDTPAPQKRTLKD